MRINESVFGSLQNDWLPVYAEEDKMDDEMYLAMYDAIRGKIVIEVYLEARSRFRYKQEEDVFNED